MSPLIAASCLATAVAGMGYLAPQITRYRAVPELKRRLRTSRSLVLTYDDGPGERTTPAVLDILGARSARGTFFLLGQRVVQCPEIVDRIFVEGHELGCHGYAHVHCWKSWPWDVSADIQRGFAAMQRWVPSNGLFRPPYGKLSLPAWITLRRRGASLAWWTIDSGDTHAELPHPQSVADAVARAGGGIVLLHDFDRSSKRVDFVLKLTNLLLRTATAEGINVRSYQNLFYELGTNPGNHPTLQARASGPSSGALIDICNHPSA